MGDRSNSYVRSGRGALDWVVSALGQKQTYALRKAMSALPPDRGHLQCTRRYLHGPKADIQPSANDDAYEKPESRVAKVRCSGWGNSKKIKNRKFSITARN